MKRSELLSDVIDRLGRRRLVWAGIRGEDVESLGDLPQLFASYSIIGAYNRRSTVDGLALENLMGRRVDLEVWDIDEHRHEPYAVEFRRAILRALNEPSALLPYRPSRFLSAIWFARRDRCLHLGLFGAHQFAFEHKPWVETSIQSLGVPGIPWIYVADEEQLRTDDLLAKGPAILRLSRTSGGQGIVRVDSQEELHRLWPRSEESFVSVAPFLSNSLPINVGGTVWNDGVTVHYPSIQLIGISECVTRPFGYCGNDFGRAKQLDREVVNAIESQTKVIGTWLRTMGYLGTFGVDYLLDDSGVLRFTEVNPRFQGSTVASSRLAVECDQPCLLLEHIAAHLSMSAPSSLPLWERLRETPPLSQAIVHWTGTQPVHVNTMGLRQMALALDGTLDVETNDDLYTEPGAVVARLTFRKNITNSGFDLASEIAQPLSEWVNAVSTTAQ